MDETPPKDPHQLRMLVRHDQEEPRMSHAPHQNGTEGDATAQEGPEVIRELQAARETKWAEAIYLATDPCGCGELTPWADLSPARQGWFTSVIAPSLMALAAEETFEATSALRQELAQAKAEVERLHEWRREICDRLGYDSEDAQYGEEWAEEVREFFPAWHGEWTGLAQRAADLENVQYAALAAEPTPAAEPHAEDGALIPPVICRRCGHYARACTCPAPVADPDDTKDGQR